MEVVSGDAAQIPLWIKLGYTVFVGVLVPVYLRHYGPANFLWFSDIALFMLVAALWWENRLLASMAALAVLRPDWSTAGFSRCSSTVSCNITTASPDSPARPGHCR